MLKGFLYSISEDARQVGESGQDLEDIHRLRLSLAKAKPVQSCPQADNKKLKVKDQV
jgi:hypothetical protein